MDTALQNAKKNWTRIVRQYMKPSNVKSYTQIINSVIPYFLTWVTAWFLYQYSVLLALLTVVPAKIFLLRIFVIMHDCGHGSFFRSKKKNDFWGFVTGVLTFSPYGQWTRTHKYHHKHAGNLDHRGVGDIDTLTIDEYDALSTWGKLKYKALRSPFVFLVFGALYTFVIEHRFVRKEDNKAQRIGVYATNMCIFLIGAGMSYFLGFWFYVIFQTLFIVAAGTSGIFLFYVQHQYEDVYWCESSDWDHVEASLKGSSYLKLPKIFQWATGNIGFHHIHHLCSSIPNYNLEKAYKENPLFQNCTVLGFKESFRSLFLSLYDMQEKRLISFREYRLKKSPNTRQAS